MSSEMTPEQVTTREGMMDTINTCDSACVISYSQVVDEETGEQVQRAKIQLFNLDAGLLLSTHNFLHHKFHSRLEFMLLDYLRILREKEDTKDENPSILDGLIDPAPAGPGPDHGGPGLEDQ